MGQEASPPQAGKLLPYVRLGWAAMAGRPALLVAVPPVAGLRCLRSKLLWK